MAAALAHGLKDAVREPLRREEQRAAGDVDRAVPRVQKVFDAVRDPERMRQVHVGQEDEQNAARTAQADETAAVLQRVREHRRATHRCDKVERDCMCRLVQPLARAASGDVQ